MDMVSPFRYRPSLKDISAKKISTSLQPYLQQLLKLANQNQYAIASFLIAMVSLVVMLVSAYPVVVRQLLFSYGFEIETIVRYIFVNLNLFLTGVVVLSYTFSKNSVGEKIWYGFVGLVIQFSLLGYFFSIAQNSYYIIAIPVLSLLIYNAHYYLLSKKFMPYFEILIYVVLFALQAFSLQEFLANISIGQIELGLIFLQSPLLYYNLTWLIIGILAITVLTLYHLKPVNADQAITFFFLIFIIFFQISWFLYNIRLDNFIYWQQMIVFVIIWDFLYMPFKMIMHRIKDDRYTARFTVYSIYHLILMVIVLLSPFYL
jgi:hypothetical protein